MNNHDATSVSTASLFRIFPGWRGNLLIFGLLIGFVLVYFFWQVRGTQKTFFTYAREHSRIIAGVIELNAKGAVLSQSSIEEILGLFLGNTARFVDYLNGIEPFTSEELTAFAQENGLEGVAVLGDGHSLTMGPPAWLQDVESLCGSPEGVLRHVSDQHLYIAIWPRSDNSGCIGVGLKALSIEELQDRIGLERLLQTLTSLAGIRYVRLSSETNLPTSGSGRIDPEAVVFLNTDDGEVAEIRRPFEDKILLVGLDAGQYFSRIRQIWGAFFLFSAVLAALGGFFSWLLYRYQQSYFQHIRSVERELAREREDAALGRAASAIAHEIRNPLNAIGMGLQRLQMEVDIPEAEDRKLISTMLQALKRTNGIVENMRMYASPLSPRFKRIRMSEIVRDVLVLYRQRCIEQGIQLDFDILKEHPVSGDIHLLSQAVENLVKNSIEAQPDGGHLFIQIDSRGGESILRVENDGFGLSAHDVEQIIEPYYTTKTRGTGLGLAIVRKTALAHGGRMALSVPKRGVLRVTLRLPILKEAFRESHADTHR